MKNNSEIYTKIFLFSLPECLILSFRRNTDDGCIYNTIKYDGTLNIKSDYDYKSYNYSLECDIEYSRGINIRTYTTLCKDKKNNKCFIFNDSYCDKYN